MNPPQAIRPNPIYQINTPYDFNPISEEREECDDSFDHHA